MSTELLQAIWAPISSDCPGGPDLTLAPELDEIRTARKGEDDGLAQGDWVRPLKAPQWPGIRARCEAILSRSSKDLQVACWYAEALTMLDGFGGLKRGLDVLDGLLDRFWDSCHPLLEGASADARIGRFEWLDRNLSQAVRLIPLTASAAGGLPWLKWEEARHVDNLGLRSPLARDEAIGEGKLTGEEFQKAALASGPAFYQAAQAQAEAALDGCRALQATLERRFGVEGPDLEALAAAIDNCLAAVVQIRQRLFPSGPADGPLQATPRVDGEAIQPTRSGPIRSRSEAILTLRTVAAFFHQTEPHSPVALLVERAATWAEMPLDSWLAEVIKDPATLSQLRELLNLRRDTKVQ